MDISFFKIYDTNLIKKRIGSQNNGGYVIACNLQYDILISCGIECNTQFENDFLKQHITSCIAFNNTMSELPFNTHPNIKLIKKKISNENSNNTTNLIDIFNNHTNIFLKMDIETCEFNWLNNFPLHLLNNISQMVIEIHFPWTYSEHIYKSNGSTPLPVMQKIDILKKLFIYHHLIHIHGNNACGTTNVSDKILPNVIECTFINKKHIINPTPSNSYVCPQKNLDFPNIPALPELQFSL